MTTKRRHMPWLWVPMLAIVEEIPFAIVTYVALLMFLQFGASVGLASMYCGLMWIPWVLKSYLRSKVRSQGRFKRNLHIVEFLLFGVLMSIGVYMDNYPVSHLCLFVLMLSLSLLYSLHDLLSRMYYNRMLYPQEQVVFNQTKALASQATIVLAYGVLIILVGLFEVFYRSYQKAWAMENSLVAGVYLLFCAINLALLRNPRVHNPYRYESLIVAFRNEVQVLERIKRKPHMTSVLASLFFLLLPQSLMFNGRVFFLLAPFDEGGLECSVQEVGFAQGAIGVMAFTLGLFVGRSLLKRMGMHRVFHVMSFVLTLSPIFYVLMSHNPLVDNLQAICCMTFFAQLFFGFGINACSAFIGYVSDSRYRNTTNYLSVPMIALVMIIPVTITGFLVNFLGFKAFFLVDIAFAPIAWIVLYFLRIKNILLSSQNSGLSSQNNGQSTQNKGKDKS